MGQTITQHASGTMECLVAALAIVVHKILTNGGNDDTILCSVKINSGWEDINSPQIISMVRDTAAELKNHEQAINLDLVGAHLLRAGGTMALKLHGYDNTTIMKKVHWTSLTFLQYIHNQVAHLSKDIFSKMSIPLPFVNVTAI